MPDPFTILIADRNPHIREFLRREMTAEGYRVRLAENGREVLKWSYDPAPIHVLILDPDLPDVDAASLISRLADRIPALPMVIHTFLQDLLRFPQVAGDVIYVEKGASSIDNLKEAVGRLVKKSKPKDRMNHESNPR